MLIKNKRNKFSGTKWQPSQVGVICGANIKEIIEKREEREHDPSNGLMTYKETIKHWAVFIHIRLDSGDQIDAVFKMVKTKTFGNRCAVPTRANRKAEIMPIVPALLAKLKINEWVELINTPLMVQTKEVDGVIKVVSFYVNDGERSFMRSPVIYPDFFEVHKGFFNGGSN